MLLDAHKGCAVYELFVACIQTDNRMNDILQAKVRQLEKQLERFSSIAQQQQSVLHEVFVLLDRGCQGGSAPLSSADIQHMKRRVHAALESATVHSGNSIRWSPEQAKAVEEQLASFAIPTVGGLAPRQVDSTATNIANRTLTSVRSLLAVWLEHMAKKVDRIMEEPQEKFQCFQDFPSEDTLTAFMDAFAASSKEVKALVGSAHKECCDSGGSTVPTPHVLTGNPFARAAAEESRLVRLFEDTVRDELQSSDAMRVDDTYGEQPWIHGDASDLSENTQVFTSAVMKSTEPPSHDATQPPQRNLVGNAVDGPTNRQDVRVPIRKPPPPLHSTVQSLPAQLQHDVTRSAGYRKPDTNASPSEAVASTPRSSAGIMRRSNDSSQVWNAMGAESPRLGSRPVPSSASASALPTSERLAALNATLQQLEFQLSGVAMHGRNSGSEAKFYGLSKKLQKVRAEIVREQRELTELRTAERERESLRQVKEEHRRIFKR